MKVIAIYMGYLLFFCPLRAQTDWKSGTYMKQSVSNTLAKGKLMELGTDFHYGFSNGICLLGAFVQKGSEVSVNYPMQGEAEHRMIAAGDENSTDIDICLLDNATKLDLTCDSDADAMPMLGYSSTVEKRYALKTQNIQSVQKSFIMTALLTH